MREFFTSEVQFKFSKTHNTPQVLKSNSVRKVKEEVYSSSGVPVKLTAPAVLFNLLLSANKSSFE